MKDPSAWRAPSVGPRARTGAPARAATASRISTEVADAHALQRARVVASLLLHPYPNDKRDAPTR
jgi:hypothetical protein